MGTKLDIFYRSKLKKIYNPKGDIWHALKATDFGFSDFGEAYFTNIHFNQTKGWKKHKEMQMNLIVPFGEVKFHIFDQNTNETTRIILGFDNYERLTVPPGYWVAFSGLGTSTNLILNISDIIHNSNESESADITKFPL